MTFLEFCDAHIVFTFFVFVISIVVFGLLVEDLLNFFKSPVTTWKVAESEEEEEEEGEEEVEVEVEEGGDEIEEGGP